MPVKLIILGGGGWVPARGRHTACALLLSDDGAVLIDSGTGVARLIERPDLMAGVRRLDIVLTHFHLDHIAGLTYLPAARLCPQTTLWGPGQVLYDTPTAELLGHVAREPYHPLPLDAQPLEVRDLPADGLELAGLGVGWRMQTRHSAPTLGLRFGDMLAWITDTSFDPDSAAFARGCHTVAHEAWYTDDAPRSPEIHSSAAQAAEVAIGADADQLLLIHLPPFEASVQRLADEAQERFPDAVLAEDNTETLLQLAGAGTA